MLNPPKKPFSSLLLRARQPVSIRPQKVVCFHEKRSCRWTANDPFEKETDLHEKKATSITNFNILDREVSTKGLRTFA
jgi:hypothetical protein